MQLYNLWRNLATGLLSMVVVLALTHMLPYYMAPVASLLVCGVLFSMIYTNHTSDQPGCTVVLLSVLYCLLAYTFLSILLVILQLWGVETFPKEIIFFNEPFMPSLIMMPTACVTMVFVIALRRRLPVCRECRFRNSGAVERGYYGYLTDHETRIQLHNMLWLFTVLTAIVWTYYLCSYINVNQNARDWYVFVWLVVLLVVLDEVYFMMRYYNLYLDLQEHNEIVTPEELRDMAAKTYLRYYVICGEYMYVDHKSVDRMNPTEEVVDSPFFTRRTVNGLPLHEVKSVIERMTGYPDGELKFFFGRHIPGFEKYSLLRYFYFLDGSPEDYKDMKVAGEWVSFDEVKRNYSENPGGMATRFLTDLSRLSTIILTEKIYDEYGQRKNPIKSYSQPLTLADVRNTKLDLQDDKWIRVSMFNSDTPFFRVKRWWRSFSGKALKDKSAC